MSTPIEAVIEKVVYGAQGIARLDGKTCFVDGAIAGETVKIQIEQEAKNFSRASIVEVLKPSPERVQPECRYYAHCGGCQYQHMTYAEELRTKEAQIREMFGHQLKLDPSLIDPIQSIGTTGYRYRSNVTLRPAFETKDTGRLGYVARDNKSAVVIDDCLLADERLQGVFKSQIKLPKDEKRISFSVTREGNVVSSLHESHYRVRLGDKDMLASSNGFFQNNWAVTEKVGAKLAEWTEKIAPFGFFDLFAGVGTFSLMAANKVTQLTLIEENAASVECMKLNMNAHRTLPNKILKGKVEKLFRGAAKQCAAREFMVFLDPPRMGLDASLAEFLGAHGPFRAIAYLSCDPATLVRDLKAILAKGLYRIDRVVPFDMFPRTRHIETLVLLLPVVGD